MIVSELKLALSETLIGQDNEWKRAQSNGDEFLLLDYLIETGNSQHEIYNRSVLYLFKQVYGNHEELLRDKLTRLSDLCDLFLKLYGDGPVTLLRAPARINILGEHVDYVSYIPTASLSFGSRERDMLMLYRVSETRRVRGASTSQAYPPVAFTLDDGSSLSATDNPEDNWLAYLYENPARRRGVIFLGLSGAGRRRHTRSQSY